jgi:hypothetical protein
MAVGVARHPLGAVYRVTQTRVERGHFSVEARALGREAERLQIDGTGGAAEGGGERQAEAMVDIRLFVGKDSTPTLWRHVRLSSGRDGYLNRVRALSLTAQEILSAK